MCGIFGIVNFSKTSMVEPEVLRRMGSVLRHRGPDHSGVWFKGNVGFGQTRLSIVDLSHNADQPMLNEDGTVVLTFNGEIYNFIELKQYLIQRGHIFRSNSDTEVVIHLWEEEGVKCLERLNGMFALALWDDNSKELFLAKDRLGKKPLFYMLSKDKIVFASEIKSILQCPDVICQPNIEAIHHYLSYQSVPSPYCVFDGMLKLPPAHYLLLKDGIGKPQRYWKLSYGDKISVKNDRDIDNVRDELLQRLSESVRMRLMGDVPVGAFLSGGIDSSLITALMAGLSNQQINTFSIGFSDKEYDETMYAQMIAKRYETRHHEFVVKPEIISLLPTLVWHYNEPFADPSAIPTYYVSKLAREHVKVILSGDGGDENFAGYLRYTNNTHYSQKRGFSSFLKRFISRKFVWPFFIGSGAVKDFQRLSYLNQQKLLYYYRITHFHELYKQRLFTDEMKKKTAGIFSVDIMLDHYRHSDARDFLDATLDLDFALYLPDTLMVKVDIAAMANSLEVRAPFLDYKFIEFAAKIPSNLKLKDGIDGKYILKLAAQPYLPKEVIYRKKMGFGVPIDHWLRNELKDMVCDVLLSKRAAERGLFKRQYIEHMLKRHINGEDHHYLIWNLLMLELWFLMFIDKTLTAPSAIQCSEY
ncbi:asparagine synthase (glutamine-hydrolyzing) [Candidatus Magnetominusculus xianensis]|uniref:asparagine synthase (glutamine-hydrolyzing) n=1 Tax=Candidatus Magnetominusculus xianensis TaxID=1748249 RepID=A0ABR5SJ26_9BACT|nr:asparagine synthase (glutamine-hydrolyzing) [Candidatus Magnetominusculus xianensis]KWT84960.1 asparagine synthetase B [Candidatus Magnetominusculus xianensis]MBF0404459.1 asparagine synthase (glutamine-hydrolyzing) [Nitrospirota bacterium]